MHPPGYPFHAELLIVGTRGVIDGSDHRTFSRCSYSERGLDFPGAHVSTGENEAAFAMEVQELVRCGAQRSPAGHLARVQSGGAAIGPRGGALDVDREQRGGDGLPRSGRFSVTSGTGGRLLRMGAIGFASGHPGSYHTALARHPAVELAGVAEVKGRATPASSEAADRLARAAGLHWHDDYRTMLDRTELDIVSVCVAPSASAEVLKTAADRGLHIISEKPLARTLEEAESIVAAVNKAGVAFSLNVPACCFSDPMRSALERVRHGDLGEPRVIFSQFLQPKGPRYAGREVDGKMVAPEYGELQTSGRTRSWRRQRRPDPQSDRSLPAETCSSTTGTGRRDSRTFVSRR